MTEAWEAFGGIITAVVLIVTMIRGKQFFEDVSS